MRFVGIELSEHRIPPRRAIRRLIGLALSVLTLGIGFLGIVFRERRRGWADRFAGTDVVYDENRPEPAPWSRVPPLASEVEPAIVEAEDVTAAVAAATKTTAPAAASAQGQDTAPSGPSASL